MYKPADFSAGFFLPTILYQNALIRDQSNIRVDISNVIYFMIDLITTLFISPA